MNMVFIVHRNFKDDYVRALDHGIDHLPVDEIDVGHTEKESKILSIRIPDVTFDAPFGLFDRNDRIAQYNVIIHRIAVPLMHEAHMGIVQGVINVIEVVANSLQRRDVKGNIGAFKALIARQWGRWAFTQISEE